MDTTSTNTNATLSPEAEAPRAGRLGNFADLIASAAPADRAKAGALSRVCMPIEDVRTPDGVRQLVDFTGARVSTVSDSYALVQNKDVIAPFIERFGVASVKCITQYGARAFTHVSIDTGRSFSMEYMGQADTIRERLIIENSYNKARSFRFMFGAFRVVCFNGLYQGQATLAIRRIHSGRIDVNAIVQGALANWENNSFALWERMQQTPLSVADETALAAEFKPFNEARPERDAAGNCTECGEAGRCQCGNAHSARTNRAIVYAARSYINRPESVDNQRNAWGLLNGINRAIAYTLKAPGALPRLISANQAAEAYIAKRLACRIG